VRDATDLDFPDIQNVQRLAVDRFRAVCMPQVADGPVLDPELLARFVTEGLLCLATFDERVVAFIACAPLDGVLHVAELDVVPAHAGNRLGALLIEHIDAWAAARQIDRLTLATYRDVPWNAPYYARLGFRECALAALGPQHAVVWQEQGKAGLDLSRRLLMARPTRSSTS